MTEPVFPAFESFSSRPALRIATVRRPFCLTSEAAFAAAAAFAAVALRLAKFLGPREIPNSSSHPLLPLSRKPPPKFKDSGAIDALPTLRAMNSLAARSRRLPELLQPPLLPPPPPHPLPLLQPVAVLLLLSSQGGGRPLAAARNSRRREEVMSVPVAADGADTSRMEVLLEIGWADAGRALA